MKAWLKPPRSLLLILFLLTLVSVSAVGWSGWKLLDQERIVEAQRAQERLEQDADQTAATLKRTLAETGDRLGAWLAGQAPALGEPKDEGLLLLLTENGISAEPAGRLLYRPFPSPDPETPAEVFADGEALEFQRGQPLKAAEWYGRLADSKDAAMRAGALMRLSRVMRNLGREAESRSAYVRLAGISGVRVAGAPAELVGRLEECELAAGNTGKNACGTGIEKDLLGGRWHLTRGQFEFYWQELSHESPPAESVALSGAAAMAWQQRKAETGARGQGTVWVENRPFFVIWRGGSERRAVLVTRPESYLKQILETKDVRCAVVDSEGRILAGHREGHGDLRNRAVVRTAAESDLPWTLYVTGTQSLTEAGMISRQRYLILGTGVMVLFLVSGTYFIGRAIRREMEVLRMQSDFVSAVSHEFRSPLTSIRQLSEILALGRTPNAERRQVYYETLVRETTRLQRLVEALLNFGKMEAGARQYRFEELDAASLVQHVVAEFDGKQRHIEMTGAGTACRIEGDPEAISVALRNLVDNALKYSPNHETVWVEWGIEREYVAIRVRDKGAGIAATERKAIFRKFVRGSAAAAANVKGSGVGLAMVRHIVAAHGGEISVESTPGEGSTFTMLLPAVGAA